jgi:deoxycytidine triphosphate deaminase
LVSVLTKRDIEQLGEKLISPFDKKCLTPVGYDLRAGERIVLLTSSRDEKLHEGKITIPPQERFAIESLERVSLSQDLFALIFTRITLAWQGLSSLRTKVDPGFDDKVILIFSNDSHNPIQIQYGETICNIMFFKYENPPPDIKTRVRPSLLVLPPFLEEIKDPLDEDSIREKYGYGIFSIMKYLKPKLENYENRLKGLEKSKERAISTLTKILIGIAAGIIVLCLTKIFV